ncbi:hypothetical protein Tco_1383227 [Tanacetum coccineum]
MNGSVSSIDGPDQQLGKATTTEIGRSWLSPPPHILYQPSFTSSSHPLDGSSSSSLQQSLICIALVLGHKSGEIVVPALAPHGQTRNLERVVPEERPPRMGPLASKAASGLWSQLSVILC